MKLQEESANTEMFGLEKYFSDIFSREELISLIQEVPQSISFFSREISITGTFDTNKF